MQEQLQCNLTKDCHILGFDTENDFFEKIEIFKDADDNRVFDFLQQERLVAKWCREGKKGACPKVELTNAQHHLFQHWMQEVYLFNGAVAGVEKPYDWFIEHMPYFMKEED